MLSWQPFLAFNIWGAQWRHLKNTTEPSMCGGDAALCQITLTTCLNLLAIVPVNLGPRMAIGPWSRQNWCKSFVRLNVVCENNKRNHSLGLILSLSLTDCCDVFTINWLSDLMCRLSYTVPRTSSQYVHKYMPLDVVLIVACLWFAGQV